MNEGILSVMLLICWATSLGVAYFFGRATAFKVAREMIGQSVNEMVHQKLEELLKRRPINKAD